MNGVLPLCTRICIEADHPALPGHFPGRPIVPGVVLLDHIAALAQSAGLGSLRRIAVLKFLAPALPGEPLELVIEGAAQRLRFVVRCQAQVILRGEGEFS